MDNKVFDAVTLIKKIFFGGDVHIILEVVKVFGKMSFLEPGVWLHIFVTSPNSRL